MVSSMDENVGRVLRKLDDSNLADRTVVILTSDNGGVDFDTRWGLPTTNAPLCSGKGTLYEGGIRVPLLIRSPGRTTAGAVCHTPVCSQGGERESSNRTARTITKHRCPTIPANPSIFFAFNSLHSRRRELRAKKNADHYR
jgi:hypothetical protein